MSTIADLNKKKWYRALKVFYILALFLVMIITTLMVVLNHYTWADDEYVDLDETMIICHSKNNKTTYTATEAGIKFRMSEFPTKPFLEGMEPTTSFSPSESRKKQIKTLCRVTSIEEKNYKKDLHEHFDRILDPEIESGERPKALSRVDWSIKPTPKITITLIYSLICLFIVYCFFELLRRIFYYVFIGQLFPKK